MRSSCEAKSAAWHAQASVFFVRYFSLCLLRRVLWQLDAISRRCLSGWMDHLCRDQARHYLCRLGRIIDEQISLCWKWSRLLITVNSPLCDPVARLAPLKAKIWISWVCQPFILSGLAFLNILNPEH